LGRAEFFIIRGFAPVEDCRAMHARVVEICRLNAAGQSVPNVFALPEKKQRRPAVED
jgi:hypothetical protein